jgi:hypothetical protein
MNKKVKKSGGKREGAGKPPMFSGPTFNFRRTAPISEAENLNKLVDNYLEPFKIKK